MVVGPGHPFFSLYIYLPYPQLGNVRYVLAQLAFVRLVEQHRMQRALSILALINVSMSKINIIWKLNAMKLTF